MTEKSLLLQRLFSFIVIEFPKIRVIIKITEHTRKEFAFMLKVIAVQPSYFSGDEPDKVIAEFLTNKMYDMEENSLILLPEYSNAGGLSDPERELKALPRAKDMLRVAACVAKEKSAYVAINVLEEREGKIFNSTYLFAKDDKPAFRYDKIHLPPSEVSLGVSYGDGSCVCDVDGIRFAFMTCYDVYYNEQLEHIALKKPDIILIPGYQRGERVDIIHAQAKLTAFRANAFVVRSSYSMNSDEKGGCSMIVAPDGTIIEDIGKEVGSVSAVIDPKQKYMRTAGFGGATVRNDDFINMGLRPEVF